MSLVYATQFKKYSTFDDFVFFRAVTNSGSATHSTRFNLIFDRYDDVFTEYIKASLRSSRISSYEIGITRANTMIPKELKGFVKQNYLNNIFIRIPRLWSSKSEYCALYRSCSLITIFFLAGMSRIFFPFYVIMDSRM